MSNRVLCLVGLVLAVLGFSPQAQAGPVLLGSGETEGHVRVCEACPGTAGLGGLGRRATLVDEARQAGDLLLVDAGNALFGEESLPSGGRVIVEAYDALGYDAANLSYRDFREGLAHTRALIEEAQTPFLSANLRDADSGERLAAPYVVREAGGQRFAIVGVTERPRGLRYLPHLREQLEGIEITDPAEALRAVLPEARDEADRVVLLYYGGAPEASAILNELGGQVDVFVGAGDEDARDEATASPPRAWAAAHGTHLSRVDLSDASGIERVALDGEVANDEALAERLEAMTRAEPIDESALPDRDPLHQRLPREALENVGERYQLATDGGNRAVHLYIDEASVHEAFNGIDAPRGQRWLVLDGSFENQMAMDLVLELDYPEAVRVGGLSREMFLVIDGREVRRMASDRRRFGNAMPEDFRLMFPGASASGRMVYPIPEGDIDSLALRYYHVEYGATEIPLLGEPGGSDELADALAGPQRNAMLELAVASAEMTDAVADREAPAGMRFVRLDIRGRSLVEGETDALALRRGADPAERVALPRVLEYLYAHKLMQLVVDGTYGYARISELSRLEDEPPMLPDVLAGGEAVFLVPAEAESLELVADFPQLAFSTLGDFGVPDSIRLPIEGEPVEPQPIESPLARVDDEPMAVSFVDARWVDRLGERQPGDGDAFLVVTVAMDNQGGEGGLFEVRHRFQAQVGGVGGEAVAALLPEGVTLPEPMWLPAGQRRAFQLVFEGDSDAATARLAYSGISTGTQVELALGGAEAGEAVAMMESDAPEARIVEPEAEDAEEVEAEQDAAAPMLGEAEADVSLAEAPAEPEEADEPEEARGVEDDVAMSVIPREQAEAWLHQINREAVNLALYEAGARMSGEGDNPSDLMGLHNGQFGRERLGAGTWELELAGQGPAPIHKVAMAFDRLHPQSSYTIEVEREGEGFEHLTTLRGTEDAEGWHVRVLEFEPIHTQRLRITRHPDDDRSGRPRRDRVLEIAVLEGPLQSKADSVLSQGGTIISRIDNGGAIFHSRDQRRIANLIRHPGNFFSDRARRGEELTWKEPITLAFFANREALIEGVEIHPPDDAERQGRMPAGVRLSTALDEPFENFERIEEYEISTAGPGEPWRITFDEPWRARFLHLEFQWSDQTDRRMDIGEIVVREGTAEGYESVLIRGDGAAWRHREQPELASLMGETHEQVRAVEPGRSAADAPAVAPGGWVGNTLDGPEQQHYYQFTIDYEDHQLPELELYMAPFLRGQVRILDTSGEVVDTVNARAHGENTLRYQPQLEPGTYVVELTSAPIYLNMVFDTSGSMSQALPLSREALLELLADLPEGVYVALATSLDDEETGSDITVYRSYTDDTASLLQAVDSDGENLFRDRGDSSWYDFLRAGLRFAERHTPPEALGATVLVGDGVGRGDYEAMWDQLRRTDQRLYTVGWGSQTLRLDHWDSSTGWTAARGLFNAAWYLGGRYYEPQRDEELFQTYQAIIDDVRTPAEYAVRLHVRDREPGHLATNRPPSEHRPTLFVLDASGSMMIEMEGRTRLDVAFDVMEQIIRDLPEGSQVGLRVYGHRYRAFGDERDDAATDSELLIPIDELDREAFIQTVRSIDARGATPLAHTIEQIPGDLSGHERPRVIVLTDGVESFRRDPVRKVERLLEAYPEMELAVVGFMIGEIADRENLRGMAEAGDGVYFNAMDSQSLVQAVEESINPVIRYTIHQRRGEQAEVASGEFGDRHELPEGYYELRARIGDGVATLPLQVRSGRTRRVDESDLPELVVVEEDEADPDAAHRAAELEGALDEEEATDAEQPAHFCTQCGQGLAADANFCTACGAAVE